MYIYNLVLESAIDGLRTVMVSLAATKTPSELIRNFLLKHLHVE